MECLGKPLKGLPPIVVRVLIFIYMEQYSWVIWVDAKSSEFRISNGTSFRKVCDHSVTFLSKINPLISDFYLQKRVG